MVGCSEQTDPRPQLVVVLDTNVPITGQLRDDATLPADAAIDTVRIDAIAGDQVYDVEEVLASSVLDWPISFGLIGATDAPVLLRIRAFRALRSERAIEAGSQVREPLPGASIDRVVRLRAPQAGVEIVRIMLDGACFGTGSRFTDPIETCIDADRVSGTPDDGLEMVDERALNTTLAGSWPDAQPVDCATTPQDGRVCIAGGFTLMGNDVITLDDFDINGLPYRPVLVSPFHMDVHELTVADVEALAAQLSGELPRTGQSCTWGREGDLPINCVPPETAAEICALRGGMLPSEAQWEHAARGRGAGLTYPWGEALPDCCTASFARGPDGVSDSAVLCPPVGIEPIGSHPIGDGCRGTGDVSRDGVVDMGGSVAELTRDRLFSYADACWQTRGVATEPTCTQGEGPFSVRGGSWTQSALLLRGSIRGSTHYADFVTGIRCIYEDAP